MVGFVCVINHLLMLLESLRLFIFIQISVKNHKIVNEWLLHLPKLDLKQVSLDR